MILGMGHARRSDPSGILSVTRLKKSEPMAYERETYITVDVQDFLPLNAQYAA